MFGGRKPYIEVKKIHIPAFKLLARKKFKNMEKKAELNKENCVKWLADFGASTSGSKQELTIRINRLSRHPGLVQKLKAKSEKAYVFPCSLDSVDIPPATAKWRASNDDLPKINNKMFTQYVSMKREGSAGQQTKALQMFTSRKIVNVKTLVNEQVVYVGPCKVPQLLCLKMEYQPKLIVVVQ